MFQLLREFKVGKPQMVAGLILLVFLVQCLWAATTRKVSDLEYHYVTTGIAAPVRSTPATGQLEKTDSPLTSWVAALPVRIINIVRKLAMPSIREALAVPRPGLLRLPFVLFGVWLGGALWWVARRLFDDEGGYVALILYCTSPAMIKISSNIGPEIILAWSSLGLIYTAIGVAHTLYAPRKKWAPRIVILGLSIGFALATAWWSFTLVLLAFAYMLYLAPGCRKKVLIVLSGATVIGCLIWGAVYLLTGSFGASVSGFLNQRPMRNLVVAFWENFSLYTFVIMLIATWVHFPPGKRKKWFGVVFVADLALPAFLVLLNWLIGGAGLIETARLAQPSLLSASRNLLFALSPETDGYVLVGLFIMALTTYGSWPRTRYFGNTAPLLTAFSAVFLLTLAPALRLWDATLGLSFIFIFIGGIAADLLETQFRRPLIVILAACFVLRAVLTMLALNGWVQNLM